MPFTPVHFGVGIAAKAVGGRRFSLGLFVVLQVVIDLESMYNLARGRQPVHRFLHTFLGAALVGLVAAALVCGAAWLWAGGRGGRERPGVGLFGWLLATSWVATGSHVVLDGVMHRDARPFWPITEGNPLLGVVGVGGLHLACLVVGFFGLVVLALGWSLREHEA